MTREPAPAAPNSLRAPSLLAAAVAAGSTLMGVGSLAWPYGRDQGNYGYAGWVWWEGGALYRDVFVFKPPLTAVLHGVAIGLFGVDMTAIRWFDLGWEAATAVLVAGVATSLLPDRRVAAVAGLAYPYFYWQLDFWNTAQTDGFMNLPIAAAVWLALAASAPPRSASARAAGFVGAGVAVGVAMAFKYTAVLALLPVAVAAARPAADRARRVGMAAAASAVGVGSALGAVAAWLGATGAWGAFVDVQLHLIPSYVTATGPGYQSVGFPAALAETLRTRGTLHAVGVGGLVALIVAPWRWATGDPDCRRALGVAIAWMVAGFGSLFVQGRLHTYHFLATLPPLALLLAIGGVPAAEAALRRFRSPAARAAVTLAAGLALGAASRLPDIEARLARVLFTDQTLAGHWASDRHYRIPGYHLGDIVRLAGEIAAETDPADRVFVWGFEPTILVAARRRTVSRYLYNYPFRVSFGTPERERELVDALIATPPRWFVVGSADETRSVDDSGVDSRALLTQYPVLSAFLADRYRLDHAVGVYDAWHLKEAR